MPPDSSSTTATSSAAIPSTGLTQNLDARAAWRQALSAELVDLAELLRAHELLDDAGAAMLVALRDRLASEQLVVAFVAEFSRGKSELINALFLSDVGRRVLPATPGRTTMCPVELRYDPTHGPRLSLLPVETRLRGQTLSELRGQDAAWKHVLLDPGQAESLVQALDAVTRMQRVSLEQATALGFWNDNQPQDNPLRLEDGSVEVPTWRHAVINYPHPLLQRGLVVIDTPGLNAVGAEPELTLGLLPLAHAVVFVLAADAGVTRSDLNIWRDHLGRASQERFVVLNKIDTLADPLLTAADVQQQIAAQCETVAQTLEVPPTRVFAVSAREALAARLRSTGADAQAVAHAGRLGELERSLTEELLPRQHALLLQSAAGVVERLRAWALQRLGDRRRAQTEQLLELRGLRGKNGGKLGVLAQRLQAEVAEFEQCASRLGALRLVQLRIQKSVLDEISRETLDAEFAVLQAALSAWPLKLSVRRAFDELLTRLHGRVSHAAAQSRELHQMLDASFRQLNADFGFTFVLLPVPQLQAALEELSNIDDHYSRYLGFGQVWRMASPNFVEQFRRLLLSRLSALLAGAGSEVEAWSRGAMGQVDVQLRERRRAFARRGEALTRVQSASVDLEQRIEEVQAQDDALNQLQQRVMAQAELALAATRSPPLARTAAAAALPAA